MEFRKDPQSSYIEEDHYFRPFSIHQNPPDHRDICLLAYIYNRTSESRDQIAMFVANMCNVNTKPCIQRVAIQIDQNDD